MFQEDYHKKEYSCFDFPTHSMFTFDVFWSCLGTSIFGNSISAANNTHPDYLPDYLSVSCDYDYKLLCMDREYINTGLINIRN